MTLSEKQAAFCGAITQLIDWTIREQHDGHWYRVRFGHALRCEECPIGMKTSLHKQRLAVDLILDKEVNDKWIYQRNTEAYRFMGEEWEQLDEKAAWGGHFNDGNHFSFAHGGRK